MRPHSDGLVWLAQPFTHALRVVASTHKKGNAHLCFVQGRLTTTAITRPSQAWTAHRLFSAGESTIAVVSTLADGGSPPPLQGFVNDQIHTRSGWHKRLNNKKEELATHGQRRPPCSVEYLMEATPVACHTITSMTQGYRDGATALSEQRSG